MSRRVTFVVGNRVFKKNRIFSPEMRDRANANLIVLRKSLHESGVELATEDIHPPDTAELVIDMNVQKWNRSSGGPIRYLITLEPPVVFPENWVPAAHRPYDKVFTWNDRLIDNEKYFLLRYAHNLGVEPRLPGFEQRQFAAMIIGFKASSRRGELYSARFDTIRWFLQNDPSQFHLYGAGWPDRLRPPASPRIERFLSRPINLLLGPFYRKNVCYRGPVADKIQTLQNYRYAFCYENTDAVPGYFTEKIFDAFRAGCVPVYMGPPNTADHIPENCFIDRRRFSGHAELYARLRRITPDEFAGYQKRIRAYLSGPLAQQFTPANFADVLRTHVVSDLGQDAGRASAG